MLLALNVEVRFTDQRSFGDLLVNYRQLQLPIVPPKAKTAAGKPKAKTPAGKPKAKSAAAKPNAKSAAAKSNAKSAAVKPKAKSAVKAKSTAEWPNSTWLFSMGVFS